MNIYLVGGAVRDSLRGVPPKDRDYVVFGSSREHFLSLHKNAIEVGKHKSVFILKNCEYTLSSHSDIEQDLASRDLTINALAVDVTSDSDNDQIFAHPLALSDLRNKILRPVSKKNFQHDPLRVFRAARFAAELPDFKMHSQIWTAMRSASINPGLNEIAAQRIGNELLKACASPRPDRFWLTLAKGQCISPWFKELQNANLIPAGPQPYHSESLMAHTLTAMRNIGNDPIDVWMATVHDLGKTATDAKLWPRHLGHDRAGEILANSLGDRLQLPKKYIQAGILAAGMHMKAAKYQEMRPGKKVDFLQKAATFEMLQRLGRLVQADNGPDLHSAFRNDWEVIRQVHLADKYKNKGLISARHLREMRAVALAADIKKTKKR